MLRQLSKSSNRARTHWAGLRSREESWRNLRRGIPATLTGIFQHGNVKRFLGWRRRTQTLWSVAWQKTNRSSGSSISRGVPTAHCIQASLLTRPNGWKFITPEKALVTPAADCRSRWFTQNRCPINRQHSRERPRCASGSVRKKKH